MKFFAGIILLLSFHGAFAQKDEELVKLLEIRKDNLYFTDDDNNISETKFLISGRLELSDLSSITRIECSVIRDNVNTSDSLITSLIIPNEVKELQPYDPTASSYAILLNAFFFYFNALDTIDDVSLKVGIYDKNNTRIKYLCRTLKPVISK